MRTGQNDSNRLDYCGAFNGSIWSFGSRRNVHQL
nr:MAG TPA: hypothetical protein [Caudoviricetes sp.]